MAIVAATQDGRIHRDQLRAAGLDADRVRRLVATGILWPRLPGVWAVGHPAEDVRTRRREPLLWLPGSALSHASAAAVWGLGHDDETVHVTWPSYAGRELPDGLRVRRRPLAERDVVEREGFRVTSLARTIVDLSEDVPPRRLRGLFREAQVRHRLHPDAVAAEVVIRAGHRGVRAVRELLRGAVDPGRVESVLELLFLEFCAAHDLPRPACRVWFGRHRVDFVFVGRGFAIECYSRWHDTAIRREDDAEKTAAVERTGTRLTRLRWRDIVDHPARTAERLRRELRIHGA